MRFIKIIEATKRSPRTLIGCALQEDESGFVAICCSLDNPSDGISLESFSSVEYSTEDIDQSLVAMAFNKAHEYLKDKVFQAEMDLSDSEKNLHRAFFILNKSLSHAAEAGIKFNDLEQTIPLQ